MSKQTGNRENILKEKERISFGTVMIGKTARMEITTVVGCMINCKYCPQKVFLKNYFDPERSSHFQREMSLDDFKYFIDRLDEDVLVCFAGMAEPWLNRACTDMVLYAHQKKHKIAVYTTLVGMTLDDFERIKELPFEEFVVHLPDAEKHSKIKVSQEYMQVLKAVVNYKRNGMELVSDYSCHGVFAEEIKEILPDQVVNHTQFNDRAGNLESENILKTGRVKGQILCSRCRDRLDQNVLLPDGTVLLCCMDYGMKHILGNLNEQSYSEILNSPEANSIREQMKKNCGAILCRNCVNAKTIYEIYDLYQEYYNWANDLCREKRELHNRLKGNFSDEGISNHSCI